MERQVPLLAGIVILFIVGYCMDPTFTTVFNIQNLVRYSAILGTLALGMTIVMLIKEIDLSVGSLMAFNIILAIKISVFIKYLFGIKALEGMHYLTSGMWLMIIFTLGIGVSIGLLNGVITTKTRVKSLITTLGVLYATRGLAYMISVGQATYLAKLEGFLWLGGGNISILPINFIIFMVLGLALIVLLRYTFIGRRIYAIGGNEKAARFAGINTDLWKILVFGFSGFCASLSSLMYSSYLASADPQQAYGYELSAIAIVVLGGTTLRGGQGGIGGTILAAFLIGILNNILELSGLRIWYQQVIIGLIIIITAMPEYLRRERI